MRRIWLLLVMLGWIRMYGQLSLPERFSYLLEATGLEFFQPLEGRYAVQPYLKNEFLSADFIMRSKREKLEIRFNVFPEDPAAPVSDFPHIRGIQMASHLASNDDESVITAISLSDWDLGEERFNADWGKLFYFRPKIGFSTRSHCQMLVLYKAGKGTVFVFYLFDEASEALDNRLFSLAFSRNQDGGE